MQLPTKRLMTMTAKRSRSRNGLSPLGLAFVLSLFLALAPSAEATSIGHGRADGWGGRGHSHADRDRHEGRGHDHELPGLSLADLVSGGQSFDSRNGKLHFADFTATPRGEAPADLEFYRVVPLGDGFRLLTPLAGRANADAGLDIGYSATTNDDRLVIDSVAASFMGVAVGANNAVDLQLRSESGGLLGELALRQRGARNHRGHDEQRGREHGDDDDESEHAEGGHEHGWYCEGEHGFRGKRHDRTALEESVRRLLIDEQIEVDAGFFGAIWAVNHHFGTHPAPAVPEPSTAVLLSLGLLGLGMTGRRPAGLRRR